MRDLRLTVAICTWDNWPWLRAKIATVSFVAAVEIVPKSRTTSPYVTTSVVALSDVAGSGGWTTTLAVRFDTRPSW